MVSASESNLTRPTLLKLKEAFWTAAARKAAHCWRQYGVHGLDRYDAQEMWTSKRQGTALKPSLTPFKKVFPLCHDVSRCASLGPPMFAPMFAPRPALYLKSLWRRRQLQRFESKRESANWPTSLRVFRSRCESRTNPACRSALLWARRRAGPRGRV